MNAGRESIYMTITERKSCKKNCHSSLIKMASRASNEVQFNKQGCWTTKLLVNTAVHLPVDMQAAERESVSVCEQSFKSWNNKCVCLCMCV